MLASFETLLPRVFRKSGKFICGALSSRGEMGGGGLYYVFHPRGRLAMVTVSLKARRGASAHADRDLPPPPRARQQNAHEYPPPPCTTIHTHNEYPLPSSLLIGVAPDTLKTKNSLSCRGAMVIGNMAHTAVYDNEHAPPCLYLNRTTISGRDEGERRVRPHADRRREVPLLPAAGVLLPGACSCVLPPHLPRAGPGAGTMGRQHTLDDAVSPPPRAGTKFDAQFLHRGEGVGSYYFLIYLISCYLILSWRNWKRVSCRGLSENPIVWDNHPLRYR